MGIELELHSERPAWSEGDRWDASRGTLLRGSYGHGKALAQVLARARRSSPGRLGSLVPFDDTLFDGREAEAALAEIPALLTQCGDDGQLAAVQDLAALLTSCAATPGSYLWCMGD